MNSRYIGALVLAPFVIFLFIGGVFLKWGILALSLGGMYEFYKVIKNKGIHPIEIVGYLLCLIYYIPLLNSINYKIFLYNYFSCFYTSSYTSYKFKVQFYRCGNNTFRIFICARIF